MFEVEAKLRLRDRAGLEAVLRRLGARPQPARRQVDTFLRHPARDLAAGDEALRVRRDGDAWELTYKGPRLLGATKARVEHNVGLGSDPGALLAALGFVPAATVRKTRAAYRFGDVEVAIDDVEGAGLFVEVEATGPDRAAAARLVEDAVHLLGLADAPREDRPYVQLVQSS